MVRLNESLPFPSINFERVTAQSNKVTHNKDRTYVASKRYKLQMKVSKEQHKAAE